MTLNRKLLQDVGERTFWTFLEAGAGVVVAAGGFGVNVLKAAAVAGGIAIAKGILAGQFGNRRSASSLPAVRRLG